MPQKSQWAVADALRTELLAAGPDVRMEGRSAEVDDELRAPVRTAYEQNT